ncbi:MAG: leucine-rich repeat domain-containing protein [Promethearchaeota archaeon]
MEITPKIIYENFLNNHIGASSAISLLISIIENTENNSERIQCLEILNKIEIKNDALFFLLENLLISDTNETIKLIAARGLQRKFPGKALPAMKYVIKNINSIDLIVEIIQLIGTINNKLSRNILLEELSNIKNQKCKRILRDMTESGVKNIDVSDLAAILVNFLIIDYFEKKNGKVDFTIENGLLTELNLSSLGSNLNTLSAQRKLPRAIGALIKLEKLNLRINDLPIIPKTFDLLSSLKFLDLSYNKIRTLPKSFSRLKSLEQLYLRYNDLDTLPESIGSLKSLKILDLHSNKLSRIPESIGKLKLLSYLDLCGNQLLELPASMENLSSLKYLELSTNNLRILPESMKNLKNLQVLSLGRNKSLKYLPEWFGGLKSLQKLVLNDNGLHHLPQMIGQLTSLKQLDLRNNKIARLPDFIANLTFLEVLNLSWNKIIIIPDWIGSLKSLKELNLWGNKIEKLPQSLRDLKSLNKIKIKPRKFKDSISTHINSLKVERVKLLK